MPNFFAWVTDARGGPTIGAPIRWEYNGDPMPLPATSSGWDSRSMVVLDTSFNALEVPLPYATAIFKEQRLDMPTAAFWTFYNLQTLLPRGRGPYSAGETLPLVFGLTYVRGPGIPSGLEGVAPLRLNDDAGWTAATDTRAGAQWPVGSRTGTRTLTVCVPEPYAIPEECRAITITVVP